MIFNVRAEPLRIAVASNFKAPLERIIEHYNKQSDQEIKISSASSGTLYQQLMHGAPFDIFLSADELRPDLLISNKLAVENSKLTYAIGQLVFYAPNDNVSNSKLTITKYPKIVLASYKHAPYGIAAKKLIDKLNYGGTVITAANIAAAFQIVHSQHAPAGFVSLSHILQNEVSKSEYKIIDSSDTNIIQAGVILQRSKLKLQAQHFLSFLVSEPGKRILAGYGYLTPNS